ncbi:hypothetical protein ACFFJF_10035 [Allobacillus sp. GCM10007489]|uniref:hypothetical protein n=1 Tax=unclassified Allobacillus TaxID=2628859 RepID=UPI002103827E|nr:hypothetical protein [Allobacillus sp. SKP2-8]
MNALKNVNYILVILVIVLLFFVLDFFAINIGFYLNTFILMILRFATTMILPWIALYWLIRLVKAIEKRNDESKEG